MSNHESLAKQIDGTHYKDMGIQPWEIIEKNKLDYFEGAVLKYLLRWKQKDGVIDLDKIIHYVERIKEMALSGHYGDKFITKQVVSVIDLKNPIQNWNKYFDSCIKDTWNIISNGPTDYGDQPLFNITKHGNKVRFKSTSKDSGKAVETRSVKKRTKPSIKKKVS